jgi:AFG3 family protein
VLGRDDLVRILGKRPFADNKEFSKYFDGTGGVGKKSAPPPPPTEQSDNPPEVPSPV